jgi:hypothetical protein
MVSISRRLMLAALSLLTVPSARAQIIGTGLIMGPGGQLSADGIAATVDLNFVSGIGVYNGVASPVTSLLTTSRTTTGGVGSYIDDLSGTWRLVTDNQPRISNKGLLIEEARTNNIKNNSMQGAIPGTPGTGPNFWFSSFPVSGIAANIIGTGTENGIDYIDYQFVGTTGGVSNGFISFDTGVADTSGVTWAGSIFAKLVGGSLTNINPIDIEITEQGTGGTSTSVNITPNSNSLGSQRTTVTHANTGTGSTLFLGIRLSWTAGSLPINATIRIGWPQLEQGAFVTSPIRTTAAAVTRNLDIVTLTSPPVAGASMTEYVAVIPLANTSNQFAVDYTDGTITNEGGIFRATNAVTFISNGGNGGSVVTPVGSVYKAAASFITGSQHFTTNGGSVLTLAQPFTTGLNHVNIGLRADQTFAANGYVQRTALWPTTRISDAGMQALTSTPGILAADGVQASVDLNFAANSGYNQGASGSAASFVTTSRTTTGSVGSYIDDASGNWHLVADNVPRISNKGILVEEARTNSLPNNSMQGAAIGTPGSLPINWSLSQGTGIVPNIVGLGTESGIDYIDLQFQGTASAGNNNVFFFAPTGIAAANGQTWTGSAFVKLQAGSLANLTNILVFELFTNSGGGNTEFGTTSITPTSASLGTQRYTTTFTSANATTANITALLQVNPSGGPINLTLRIGWPQLEQGAFATSPIRTTGSAVTRNQDIISLTSVPAFGTAASVFASSIVESLTGGAGPESALAFDDGTGNNRIQVGTQNMSIVVGGNVNLLVPTVTQTVGVLIKQAIAYASGNHGYSQNGAAAQTGSTAGTVVGLNHLDIGQVTNGFQLNGYITRAAVWPTYRISNAGLQALTT